ncbi:MAG: hypothetical protein QOG15_2924 [Solirubrobacteraceae bacterium]|nr:hypothetical protein [Solirubrobacteraceae bacterium]
MSSGYEHLADLPLEIEGYKLAGREMVLNPYFTRHTTVVHLHARGEEGLGEDVTYDATDQLSFQRDGRAHELTGSFTVDSFSSHVADIDLFGDEPAHPDYRDYRRWAFESAALDLALRQAGLSLADALGRASAPLHFVVSPGPEASLDPLLERLTRYPAMRLKLMPAGWDEAYVAGLAATDAVDVVDLKGQWDASIPADVPVYRRVAEGLPDAWIEDPKLTPETEEVLAPHRDRVTWDAPIHSVRDIERLASVPRMLNVKPSRSGTIRALLEIYEHCERAGIGVYGGGQSELGPGRGQIQTIAAMFHPDAPNDVAPCAYNEPELRDGLSQSPLPVPEPTLGFR